MNEKQIDKKKEQIKAILRDGASFGMALSVIRSIEADLLRDGDTFLKAVPLKEVSP